MSKGKSKDNNKQNFPKSNNFKSGRQYLSSARTIRRNQGRGR